MSSMLGERSVVRTDKTEDLAEVSKRRTWRDDWKGVLSSSRQFDAYFFLSAMVIILVFMIYTQVFVMGALRQDTRQMIKTYAFFYSIATRDTIAVKPGPDLNIIFETITNTNFPVVITDETGQPQLWKAVGVPPEDNRPAALEKVREVVRQLDVENPPYPFQIPKIGSRVLHYGDPPLVKRLSWLPWVALCVTVLFVGLGYAGFRHIKNSEQRSIWVGMARETAHQLGTPLSSLYGWIELMKSELETSPEQDREKAERRFDQIVTEMEKDTSRLNKIASRFSQIGSTPELRLGDLNEVVSEIVAYLRNRLPRDVQIEQTAGEVPALPMNRELLEWALENLFKNAADAIEGKGGRIEVSTQVRQDGGWIDILIRDDGKGIPSHLVKQVFMPGYSTKKRGWGLGLTFVKRIVEDYHRGKISVRESIVGGGTTFLISLPTTSAGAPVSV